MTRRDILYWNIIPECISIIILLIIWSYSRKGSNLPTLTNQLFQACFLVTFLAISTNILSNFSNLDDRTCDDYLLYLHPFNGNDLFLIFINSYLQSYKTIKNNVVRNLAWTYLYPYCPFQSFFTYIV